MKQLSQEQYELVSSLANRLGTIRGVRAVVLGGSHARGRAQAGSDIDLGLLYSEAAPFSTDSIRELAEGVNDSAGPVVTNFYEWGPWVNGGAWLTIGGQRVDFVYRSLEHVERVIAEAEAGRYEVHYAQQPPFGFFSGTYLGEIAVCIPLYLIDDKTALAEITDFERTPREFGPRVQKTLTHLGGSVAELLVAVETIAQLAREATDLTDGLYRPRYTLPK